MAKKAAVIGNPVSHSLSPRVHGWWLKHYGIEGSYEAIRVDPEGLAPLLKGLGEQGFAGCNITIPYKEDAMDCLDFVDESADIVGAVNTIVVQDGKLYGRNTDVYGFVTYVQRSLPDRAFRDKKVVMIGAGGAARAIAAGILGELKAQELVILNRTKAKADAIREHFSRTLRYMLEREIANPEDDLQETVDNFIECITIGNWEDKEAALADAALLVNSSALGMVGQAKLELDLSALPADAVVADIVFNPLETELLKAAAARGLRTVDGLGMLLHQAAPGFKLWFDPEDKHITGLPEVTPEQRAYVLEGLK